MRILVQNLILVDIPADLKEKADKYRKELVEAAVEEDEKLMEAIS